MTRIPCICFWIKCWKAIRWEYRVFFHAYNGKEALVLLEREKPDIMLLDVKMPVMDGLETLRQINAAGIQVRTIILSAYNEFEYARKALLFHVRIICSSPLTGRNCRIS